jgi:hypothetical protein
MAYTLVTPYRWETYVSEPFSKYARLAGRRFNGGTIDGSIPISMTDVARGQSLLVTGTTVVMTQTPSQDDLAAASYYFLGGHEYEISDEQAAVLIAAGYSDYVTPIV